MTLEFAVMHLMIFFNFLLLLSFPLFLILFKKSCMINRLNGLRYKCVLALCVFFNRGGTKGTNSSKILCSIFVCVLFYVNLCTGLISWFLNNFWFDDLRAE